MSILYAALNPNISAEQLTELVKKDEESKIQLIDTFEECFNKLETKEQKMEYMEVCFPILLRMIWF